MSDVQAICDILFTLERSTILIEYILQMLIKVYLKANLNVKRLCAVSRVAGGPAWFFCSVP